VASQGGKHVGEGIAPSASSEGFEAQESCQATVNVKLYVGNLSFSVGDQQLREAFSPHGNLLSASVVTDRETGQSRGFGFVEYGSSSEAEGAIAAMNGASLDGRSLNVNVAKPREGGGGGGGGRGGGGGGGGRDSRGGGGGGGRGDSRGGGGGGKRW
jgi:cold-inducible RNA-binding protein